MSRRRTERLIVTSVTSDGTRRSPDRLIVEEPMTIQLDGVTVATTMRTPGNDFELAAGFCHTEGLLDGAWQALNSGGILVANAVTLEGQAALSTWRERVHGDFATLSVSRGEAVGRFTGLRPLMPVLQWVGRKP